MTKNFMRYVLRLPTLNTLFSGVVMSFVVVLSLLCVSCDDHEAIDDGIYPGFILCDDGSMMSEDAYMSQSSRVAVGVLFTDKLDDGRYLAVLLQEAPPLMFCDSIPMKQNTSCDVSAFDGFSNTTSLQNTSDSKTGHGSPLGSYAFSIHTYGQSDFIPSVGEYQLLHARKHVVNGVLRRLSAKHAVDLLDESGDDSWYWTSTEVSGNESRQAWLFSMSSGTKHETPKDERHHARVICSFYPVIKP